MGERQGHQGGHRHHHDHGKVVAARDADATVEYDVVELSEDVLGDHPHQAEEEGKEVGQYYGKPLPHPPVTVHPEWAYGGTWARKKNDARRVDREAPTPQCHATTLLNLPGGKVMMGWFGGTFESAEDVKIFTGPTLRRARVGGLSVPAPAPLSRCPCASRPAGSARCGLMGSAFALHGAGRSRRGLAWH